MAGSTSRNRRDLGLAFASFVLFINGLPMAFAAIVNCLFGRTVATAGLGLLLAPIGVGMIWTAICLRAGGRPWWLAALILLPVAAAGRFFDAYAVGKGEFPLVWGVLMPAGALACLLMPALRAVVMPTGRSPRPGAPT